MKTVDILPILLVVTETSQQHFESWGRYLLTMYLREIGVLKDFDRYQSGCRDRDEEVPDLHSLNVTPSFVTSKVLLKTPGVEPEITSLQRI